MRIANPIYTEVVPRELTDAVQEGLLEQTAWYVREDGSLDLPKLLAAFQEYFRENAEHWPEGFAYKEVAPLLLLQAYLQRVVSRAGGWSGSTGWDADGRTCWCCGRTSRARARTECAST